MIGQLRFRWVHLLIMVLWVGLVYSTSFTGAFVFDDEPLKSPSVYDDFEAMHWFKPTNRPFSAFTFAFQYATIGGSPLACHVVNLAIHVATMIGLVWLIDLVLQLRLGGWDRPQCWFTSLIAAGLWAVHPLATASVTYIIQRHESLASCLMVYSCLAWLLGHVARDQDGNLIVKSTSDWRWQCASLVAALFAFGSKEMAAGLPLMLLLLDHWPLQKNFRQTLRTAVVPGLLLLIVGIGGLKILPQLLDAPPSAVAGFNLPGINPVDYWLAQPRSFFKYIQLMAFPAQQVLDYGWLPPRDATGRILGTLGWGLVTAAWIFSYRYSRCALVLISISLLTLLPSSMIPMPDVIFEHRCYLILAVAMSAIVVGVTSLAKRRAWQTKWLLVAVSVIGLVYSAASLIRNSEYALPGKLARLDMTRQPGNPRSIYRVSLRDDSLTYQRRRALLWEAINESEKRGYFYPTTQFEWSQKFADEMFGLQRDDLARKWYLYALQHAPSERACTELQWSLALVASRQGRLEDAENWFQKSLINAADLTEAIQMTYRVHKERTAQTSADSKSDN